MDKVIFGNHSAIRVRRTERDRIHRFYRDVLGCKIMREFDDKDDFRMGDGFYIAFIYAAGSAATVDTGATYAADDALSDDDFLKAVFLELKTHNVEEMEQKIVAFESGCSTYRIPIFTFRVQEDRCSGWSESTRTYDRQSLPRDVRGRLAT